jgi:molybdopterin-guanine dinucleotide biosynthesis protein MobB
VSPCPNHPAWPPVMGIVGDSNSGKTLLVEQLVPALGARGLRVAVVKRCSHQLHADQPGKDSDRAFQAGADVLAVSPDEAFARFHEGNMPLAECVRRVAEGCDVVLAEGFREAEIPKIYVAGPVGRGLVPRPERPAPAGTVLVLHDVLAEWPRAEEAVLKLVKGDRQDADV